MRSFHYLIHCVETPYVCVWLVALLRAWGRGSCENVSLLLWLLSQPAPGSLPCVVSTYYYVYLALNAPLHLWCPQNQAHWVSFGFGAHCLQNHGNIYGYWSAFGETFSRVEDPTLHKTCFHLNAPENKNVPSGSGIPPGKNHVTTERPDCCLRASGMTWTWHTFSVNVLRSALATEGFPSLWYGNHLILTFLICRISSILCPPTPSEPDLWDHY